MVGTAAMISARYFSMEEKTASISKELTKTILPPPISVDEGRQVIVLGFRDLRKLLMRLHQRVIGKGPRRHFFVDEDDIFDIGRLLAAGLDLGPKLHAA